MSTKKTGEGRAHPRDPVDSMKARARAAGAAVEESLKIRTSRCCEPRHTGRTPCVMPSARTRQRFPSTPTPRRTSISKSTRGSEGPRSRWPKRSPRQARRVTDTIGAAVRRGKGVHRPAHAAIIALDATARLCCCRHLPPPPSQVRAHVPGGVHSVIASHGWRRRGERKRTLPLAALVTRSDGTLSQRDRAALNRRRRRGPALMGRSTGPRFVSARASRRRRRGTCSARIRGASALAEAQSPDQKRGWRIPGKVPGPDSRLRSAVSAVVREGSVNGARSSQRPTSGPRLA